MCQCVEVDVCVEVEMCVEMGSVHVWDVCMCGEAEVCVEMGRWRYVHALHKACT